MFNDNYDYGHVVETITLTKQSVRFGRIFYRMSKLSLGWIKIEFGDTRGIKGTSYHLNGKGINARAKIKRRKGYKIEHHALMFQVPVPEV
jgi:hypothetical protein